MSIKDLYQVLQYPVNTEKSMAIAEKGIYIFKVLQSATKEQIRRAIELVFEVKVRNVRTLNTEGKIKVFKGHKGRRSNYKKAIVRLESNYKIDLLSFEMRD